MRKKLFIIITLTCGIGIANAAVRDANTIKRSNSHSLTQRQGNIISRSATTEHTTQQKKTQQSRNITNTTKRTNNRNVSSRTQPITETTTPPKQKTNQKIISRASNLLTTPASNTFNISYNSCREAYFTCMDQFCASANDTYRRCICSSKLTEIQSRERALTQTADQLEDFKTFNMYAIDKTASEANAMVTASDGEAAQENITDKSNSALALTAITDVLSKTKTKSTAPEQTNNFSSNISITWNNSDLIGGTNIANLTGETLYNTVNAQCLEMVKSSCPNETTTQMVTSAYGMYIENDCSQLISNLDKKKKSANSEIRKTGYEMESARLDNYNVHNSSNINDCLAMIRKDLTAETACGPDYVHCLDITGQYLNYQTGEPIYTANFYELNSATSLSGDILTNNANNLLITELNNKKIFAEKSLNTCRDLSSEIWDEFLRQAIAEIHQEQQARIRKVKTECLSTVISCYDQQNAQLTDFSNIEQEKLLGMRLELSEEMCSEKLNTCSNLYGGGSDGMQELLNAIHNIVSEQIATSCLSALEKFAQTLCTPSEYEGSYTFPFECRNYTPGNEICATINDYTTDTINCGDYDGSLYQKLAKYALETCIRPSEIKNGLTPSVIKDVNIVMNNIRTKMAVALTTECEKQDGQWLQYYFNPKKSYTKNHLFYIKTPAHEKWGTCITK